jgi:hypothetical protein
MKRLERTRQKSQPNKVSAVQARRARSPPRGKRSTAQLGGAQRGGEGEVGKCSCHRRGDDVDFCVAILGCHLNGKGNQLSHLLFLGREGDCVLLLNRVVFAPAWNLGRRSGVRPPGHIGFRGPKKLSKRSVRVATSLPVGLLAAMVR